MIPTPTNNTPTMLKYGIANSALRSFFSSFDEEGMTDRLCVCCFVCSGVAMVVIALGRTPFGCTGGGDLVFNGEDDEDIGGFAVSAFARLGRIFSMVGEGEIGSMFEETIGVDVSIDTVVPAARSLSTIFASPFLSFSAPSARCL